MEKPKIVLFNPKPTFRYFYKTLPIQLLAISSLIHKDFDFNVKLTPWITEKQASFTELLNTYIFPLKSNLYKDRIKRNKHKYIFGIANFVLHNLASLRWKLKFFHFPLEYYLFKKYIKKKNEI